MTKVDTFTFSDGLNPGRKQARLACVFGGLVMHALLNTSCRRNDLHSLLISSYLLIIVFFSSAL
jgi:hypothetical protein